jgi:hypothetical protein
MLEHGARLICLTGPDNGPHGLSAGATRWTVAGSPTQKANGARIHSGFIPGHVGEERGHDLLAVQVEHLADRQVEHRPRQVFGIVDRAEQPVAVASS